MTTTKIAGGNVTLDKLADGTTNNNIIRWNATTTQWEETNLATGLGENVESTDGSITGGQNSAALVAMDLGVNVDNSTLEIDPTDGVQIANGGVTTDEILNQTILEEDIANDAVTTIKILDANVTPSKIQGGSANTLLRTDNTGTTVQWDSHLSLYHAIGKVNNSTATSNILGANISNLGTGNYQVTFSTNANSDDYIIQLSVLNAAGNGYSIEVVTQDPDNFTVQISDSTGAAADASWYFTVIDF